MKASTVEPHVFVVMGATGDLMRRKLLPALRHLVEEGSVPAGSVLVGTSRDETMDDAAFARLAGEALAAAGCSPDRIDGFLRRVSVRCQRVREGEVADLQALRGRIVAIEREAGLGGNRVIYLAMPPSAFPTTIQALGEAGMARSAGWTRLVVEKPFGRDLGSARELNDVVHRYFDEGQVYRIDHYLGKETVQNLLVFRFTNPIFESLWNRDRVESVEITVAECLGIERRANYYEQAGVVRDMIQNHLLQVMALLAMEVPSAFDADAIRHEKVKVFKAIRPIRASDVVFGQYAGGRIEGEVVPAYRDEPGVADESRTPTYAAVRVAIENWRWQGVPFFLRTGKRLLRQTTRVAVTFKRAPVYIFAPFEEYSVRRNVLYVTLQPDEGFSLCFQVKTPGSPYHTRTQELSFHYQEVFGPLPDAYDTLVLDVLEGDQTLFVSADEVESAWSLCAPILDPGDNVPVHEYAAGSWGPAEARALLGRHGTHWQVE